MLVWQRVVRELGLGALALGIVLVVIVPALSIVNAVYQSAGPYTLLIVTVAAGVVLLVYQARVRTRRY